MITNINKSEQRSLGLSQIYRPIFYFIKKAGTKEMHVMQGICMKVKYSISW